MNAIDKNVRLTVEGTKWYKQMHGLSEIHTDEFFNHKNSQRWISAPGAWGVVYNLMFYWPLGRLISVIATSYSILLLCLGSGEKTGAVHWTSHFFPLAQVSLHYWLSVSALVWPTVCIAAGTYICSGAHKFLDYQTQDLGQRALEDVTSGLQAAEEAVNATPVVSE
ncbi:hypothetical protein [Sphingobium sp. B11D3A]|uniref:hypothetical protein n=1 Tax=Sphingobium sp. B11D3A TaxID=2940574 RepID=UPI002224EA6C|nr:hypothetical protein [Sphingobium sp. B11D3A]MCW2390954.1 hypothetical protein [Sphingobium sp. B11D3A]